MPTSAPVINGVRPPGNAYVLPDHKIVYVSVTKAACTSLRWMIADLAGEDFARFYRAPDAHQTRLMTIHSKRIRWQHVRRLGELSLDEIAGISRDNGWFIFAMVRDPWSRLWSAWQSKFLVHLPRYLDNYAGEPWFPRIPEKPSDVVDDWFRFVEARPWRSHPVLVTDRHFQPQVRSVRPRLINYTRVYDVREIPELLNDLTSHLERLGKAKKLYLPQANETPLRLTAEVLGNGVRAAIEDAYRPDFAQFGELWNFADLNLAEDGWTGDAIRAIGYHTVANERIGDLSRELKKALRLSGAMDDIDAGRMRAAGPAARARAAADRLRSRLRRRRGR